MSSLERKIDFAALITVNMANSNGDPLNGNRPRTDYDSYGEISDVCIKRKIRNRMQDLGQPIFVQSEDRCDDGMDSLSQRANAALKDIKDKSEYAKAACAKWLDVRAFGQVFAFSSGKKDGGEKKKGDGVSVGVRGPVSIHQAVSISPVDVLTRQITKSVNGESDAKRSSDTMGYKHLVRFGLYLLKGSVNVQLAEKTGFSAEDATVLKECLRTLFRNDVSAARPDGSMQVYKLYWWEHNCKDGQYSSGTVHHSLHVTKKESVLLPSSVDDYDIVLDDLDGLQCEEIVGE